MLEVITALAIEEAHSKNTHSRAASSPRDAQGTPTQSATQASTLQGTADFQGTAEAQEERSKRGEEGERRCLQSNWEKKDKGNLSEEHHDQDDHNHTAFVYEDFDATNAVVADLESKSDETEERKSDKTKERKSDETEERKSDET
ncbi:hypothetical protein Tco_0170462 [Tanacetum coccineum]